MRHRSLHSLILDLASRELRSRGGRKDAAIRAAGIKPGKGLRQGMPMSAFLSNLVLCDFDREIENSDFTMLRYADDLIFFCESEEQCLEAEQLCQYELGKQGLTVYKAAESEKSKVYAPGQ